MEFNFTRISRLPDEELPDAAVLDSFLGQLGGIDALLDVAMNLRASRFASRKPNVPLSELSDDSIRTMVEALKYLV